MKNHFLKKTFIFLGISLGIFTLSHCTSSTKPSEESLDLEELDGNSKINISYSNNSAKYKKETFKMLDADKIQIDSLYIQVAYELSANRWIIIGNSVDKDPTGLKLLLVDPSKDYELIYRSKGAYESLILHPSFYISEEKNDPMIILCSLGQLDSWGQNLFLMKGDTINEIAYLDVALKQEAEYEDEEYSLKDISPFTQIEKQKNGIVFSFNADSIIYFGVRNNVYDPIISANSLKYRYKMGELIEEWQE